MAVDVSPEKEKLIHELEQTVNELLLLAEAGKQLTRQLETPQVLQSIIDQSQQVIQSIGCLIYVKDNQNPHVLRCQIAQGHTELVTVGHTINNNEEDVGQCAHNFSTLVIKNVSDKIRVVSTPNQIEASFTADIICLPLICHNINIGVIKFICQPHQLLRRTDLSILSTFADFAAIALENAKNYQRVEDLAIIDDCTHLFNARYLKKILPLELNRADRYHHALAVLFIDLDLFKKVNDQHGHLAGSDLLKEFGDFLTKNIRSTDLAIRFGGDEFIVLMPETDQEGALLMTQRLQQALNQYRFLKSRQMNIKQTASFGIAVYPQDGIIADELIAAADAAMYRIKETHRDGICCAQQLQ